MPEVPPSIPPLQLFSDNSESEMTSTSGENTYRSPNIPKTPGRNHFISKRTSMNNNFSTKNNFRRPYGKHQSMKPTMRLTPPAEEKHNQKKSSSFLYVRSQIPRALNRSSCTTNAFGSGDSVDSVVKSKEVVGGKSANRSKDNRPPQHTVTTDEKALLTVRSLNTGFILAFRRRKSYTQMDFNHTRRSPTTRAVMQLGETESLTKCDDLAILPTTPSFYFHKIYSEDSLCCGIHESSSRMAGMRIFLSIMLNAWRKRRDEVKRLIEEVGDLKVVSSKAKTQLHALNALFRLEKQRNDELNRQLMSSLKDVNMTKASFENLTTSLISIKADKSLLEQQLQIKEQEYDSLNTFLGQTKTDLFKAMAVQRELQSNLSDEQRKVQVLENQKNELINEICELNAEFAEKEAKLLATIQAKSQEIITLKNDIKDMELQILAFNETKNRQMHEQLMQEEKLKNEIDELQTEIIELKKCISVTFMHRMRNYWQNSLIYQKSTLQLVHWLAFCVLPAIPPPTLKVLPIGFSLYKALNIIKR